MSANCCFRSVADRAKKLGAYREQVEKAQEIIEERDKRIKDLELEVTAKDQEIQSLTHRNDLHEKTLEEHEVKLAVYKGLENDESGVRSERESLLRKIALLEEEAEQNDKNLKETTEKYPAPAVPCNRPIL